MFLFLVFIFWMHFMFHVKHFELYHSFMDVMVDKKLFFLTFYRPINRLINEIKDKSWIGNRLFYLQIPECVFQLVIYSCSRLCCKQIAGIQKNVYEIWINVVTFCSCNDLVCLSVCGTTNGGNVELWDELRCHTHTHTQCCCQGLKKCFGWKAAEEPRFHDNRAAILRGVQNDFLFFKSYISLIFHSSSSWWDKVFRIFVSSKMKLHKTKEIKTHLWRFCVKFLLWSFKTQHFVSVSLKLKQFVSSEKPSMVQRWTGRSKNIN